MLEEGKGAIVIASSVTGDIVADAGEAAYAMTKAALVGLTRCLAVEYADRHIRVNCSQLGYARTPMVEKMAVESNPEDPESAINDIAVGVPMKRLASPPRSASCSRSSAPTRPAISPVRRWSSTAAAPCPRR